MLLPFSIRVAEGPPAWERAVHSVNYTCLSWALFKFCVCPPFPFGIKGGMWNVIVLIPDHCFSILLSKGPKNEFETGVVNEPSFY